MKQNKLMLSASLVLASSLIGGVAHATPKWCVSGKPVKFAAVTWESAQFFTEVARIIVENGYDCKTESVTGSTAVTEAALASNDLQVWMEQWDRTDVIKKGREAGKLQLLGNILQGGTEEGWYVPDYVVKGDSKRGIKALAPDLKSVADLAKYKDLFKDEEDPSKGRFLNCPTGWDCERINNQKFKAYKMQDSYTNFRPGTGGSLDATITSAIARGKPVLFYYWSPAALMGKYNFIKLSEPAFTEKCWKTLQNTTTDDVCGSATPPFKLYVGASTPFIKEAPEIVDFFGKFTISSGNVNKVIAEMTERKIDGALAAKEFLIKNKVLLRQWLPSDVAAKVEKSL